MLRKWVILNLVITLMIIVLVGFSIKEFACYQFNLYSESSIQSAQFRRVIEEYLFYAGILAVFLATLVHLFFARKILQPLHRLRNFLNKWEDERIEQLSSETNSKDELWQIENDLINISNHIHHLQQQRDRMMTDLAHELRTPLTTLYGYLEGLEDGIFTEDESITAILKNECSYLIKLIERINELYKWENENIKLTYESVHLQDYIHSKLKKYANIIEKLGLKIECDIYPIQIYCDQYALSAILYELFENVFQYHVNKSVKIEGKNLGEEVVIFVSNQGRPIPKIAEEQLFERFYRIDSSRNRNTGGSGLGLAITNQIVLRLKGKIGFYSKDNLHTFWFSIPKHSKE